MTATARTVTAGLGGSGERRFAGGLLVAVLAPLPFLPTLWAGLLADDFFFAALLRELATPVSEYVLPALLQMRDVPTTFYRPLAFITLYAETRAWNGWPVPMHAFNLALHAASATGVWWLATRLSCGPASRVAAVIAALQWAWFPRRVEAVAWLSCRPDLLATALATWAIAAWMAGEQRGSRALRSGGVLLWMCALASKESVVSLPLALVALPLATPPDTTCGPPSLRRRVVRLWPFAASLPAFFALRRLALGTWIGGYGAGALAPSATTAAKHLVYPIVPPLEFLNRALLDHSVALAMTAVMIVVTVCLWAALWRGRGEPGVRFGAAWVLAAVLPVVTLLPSLTSTMNDRLLYVPAIGFALALAGWLSGRGRLALRACAFVVAVLALQTLSFAQAWRVAGERTARIVEEVAAFAREVPEALHLFVAAAPDSYRGAYMLRNGLAFALRRLDVAAPARAVVLSGYLVEDPAVIPVLVRPEGDATLHLAGRNGRTEVMLWTPDMGQWADVWVSGADDRFGRHREARLTLRKRGLVLVVSPSGVERLRVMGPPEREPEPERNAPVPVRQ